jgi:hypothetical protein
VPESDGGEKKEFKIPAAIFPVLSWSVALYFLSAFIARSGFPAQISQYGYVTAGTGLFFLFLPFFKKIKIGKILELEREVEKAKEELREFKAEVRNNVAMLSSNVNTISGMTNRINFYNNVPSVPEMEEQGRVLEEKVPRAASAAREVENDFLQQDYDVVIALFKTRVEIERLLRKIVGKSLNLPVDQENIRMAGLPKLFDMFVKQNPKYKYLQTSLRYVNQVCSAAIHAQQVSEEQAREVLALGAKIIATLDDFLGEQPHGVQ